MTATVDVEAQIRLYLRARRRRWRRVVTLDDDGCARLTLQAE
jgi:hypothetical protein